MLYPKKHELYWSHKIGQDGIPSSIAEWPLHGKMPKKMTNQISTKYKRSSQIWSTTRVKQILKIKWSMWENRNEILHNKDQIWKRNKRALYIPEPTSGKGEREPYGMRKSLTYLIQILKRASSKKTRIFLNRGKKRF